jgi:hypothetical protein
MNNPRAGRPARAGNRLGMHQDDADTRATMTRARRKIDSSRCGRMKAVLARSHARLCARESNGAAGRGSLHIYGWQLAGWVAWLSLSEAPPGPRSYYLLGRAARVVVVISDSECFFSVQQRMHACMMHGASSLSLPWPHASASRPARTQNSLTGGGGPLLNKQTKNATII